MGGRAPSTEAMGCARRVRSARRRCWQTLGDNQQLAPSHRAVLRGGPVNPPRQARIKAGSKLAPASWRACCKRPWPRDASSPERPAPQAAVLGSAQQRSRLWRGGRSHDPCLSHCSNTVQCITPKPALEPAAGRQSVQEPAAHPAQRSEKSRAARGRPHARASARARNRAAALQTHGCASSVRQPTAAKEKASQ